MTRDAAFALSQEFEGLGWNHDIKVRADGYVISLYLSRVAGSDLLSLFNVLAPAGVPVAGVSATLTAAGLEIS